MSNDNSHDERSKNSSQVWDRLNQQSDQLGDLARAQASTEAHLAALAHSVETGFNSINTSLNRYAERDGRPTNWVGIGGLLVVSFGMMVSFVSLHTRPLADRIETNYNQVKGNSLNINERSMIIADNKARMDWLRNWSQSQEFQIDNLRARESEVESDMAYMRGRQDMIINWLSDLDNAVDHGN